MQENRFTVSGVEFEVCVQNYDLVTSKDRVVLLKPKVVVDRYVAMVGKRAQPKILELGIFEGGSAILLALLIPTARIVGIDSNNRKHTSDVVRELGLDNRITFYHQTLQQDRSALSRIMDAEFANTPLDMIIDDASHFLEPSRESFEILWPYLAKGGYYVIEDWNWAHYPAYQSTKWIDKPALTNLIFELLMAIGSGGGWASRMVIEGISASLEKAGPYSPGIPLELSKLIRARGRVPPLI